MVKEVYLPALIVWHIGVYIYSYVCSVFAEGKSAVVPHLRMRQHLGKEGFLAQGEIQGTGMSQSLWNMTQTNLTESQL